MILYALRSPTGQLRGIGGQFVNATDSHLLFTNLRDAQEFRKDYPNYTIIVIPHAS